MNLPYVQIVFAGFSCRYAQMSSNLPVIAIRNLRRGEEAKESPFSPFAVSSLGKSPPFVINFILHYHTINLSLRSVIINVLIACPIKDQIPLIFGKCEKKNL